MEERAVKKSLKAIIICTFLAFICEPITAEYTQFKQNILLFSKGGGIADNGSMIYTVNSKGIKIMNDQEVLGDYVVKSPQKESALYIVGDHVSIPRGYVSGTGTTTYDDSNVALIGDFDTRYLLISEVGIETRVSEDNVVSDGDLKIQDSTGEIWAGKLALNETPSVPYEETDVIVTMRMRPVDIGGDIASYIGVGTVNDTPRSALHVFGSLRMDNGALIGPIGFGYYILSRPATASTQDTWKTITSQVITGEFVTHGTQISGAASLIANEDSSYHSYPQVRIKLVDITDTDDEKNPEQVKDDDTSRTEIVSAANQTKFEKGWSDTSSFGVFLPYDKIFSDRTYRADLQIYDATYSNVAQASITAITIPIETLQQANYPFADVPSLNDDDPNKTVLENEEGNYLTENKIAFENGGRIKASGDDLYIVDKYADFYPFFANALEAAFIRLSSILKYVGDTDEYDMRFREGSSGQGIEMGVKWDSSDTLNDLVSANVQQMDLSTPLNFYADKTYLMDGALSIGREMLTINTPLPSVEDSDIAIDINGDLMVENTLQGGAFYVSEDGESSVEDYSAGESTMHTATFTMPSKNDYRLFIYAVASIGHIVSRSNWITTPIDVWLSGTDIVKEETLSKHKFEEFANFSLDNQRANFMMQSVVDVSAGQSYSVSIMLSASEDMRKYSSNIMVIGLPR